MKMKADNIADATARAALTGKRVEISDDDHRGLELGVSPSGVQAWSLRLRDPSGRLRRFVLGRLPAMTPPAARKAARSLRAQVDGGYDPIAEKRAKRVAGADLRAGVGTLRALVAEYERSGDPPKSWFTGSGRKRVERVFGALMPKPVREMKVSDIIREADGYSGSQNAAQNAIRALRPVISWAILREYAPVGLKALSPEQGVPERDRVLTHDELRRVLPILRSGRSPHATVMLFILLTVARLNEAAGATWGEIDLDRSTWTIPPQRMKDTRGRKRKAKARKPVVIPLSRDAVRLLRWVKGVGDPEPQSLVFASQSGTPLGNWDRAQKAIFEASQTAGWHRQDLRRTGATMMGETGIAPYVVEAALNHSTIYTDLAGRYNTARYRNDVKDALQALSVQYVRLIERVETRPDEFGEPEEVWLHQSIGEPV
ncbi:MAG: tyrosine-type recombinase/integrase [Rhodopila sp.]